MRFLLALIAPFVMAMLAFITTPLKAITTTFNWFDLSPDPRTRGPTNLLSALIIFATNMATSVMGVFTAPMALLTGLRSIRRLTWTEDTGGSGGNRGKTLDERTRGRVAQIPTVGIGQLFDATQNRFTPGESPSLA